jgi:pyruvate,water dikinase
MTASVVAGPLVLDLADPDCRRPEWAGAKAANLARAAVAGLPTLPGFALTTASFDPSDPDWTLRGAPEEVLAALRPVWGEVSEQGTKPLVVRSSSTIEDIGESSMAGQFHSALDVVGWDGFLDAVQSVLASSRSAVPGGEVLPMAVLVQQQLDARCGGVAFGIDPVSGDPKHALVEAVPGGPEQLVSGTVTAQRYVVNHRGRCLEVDLDDGETPLLDRHHLRAVVRLVERSGSVFGTVQDIEWAYDTADRLWLLQSRPVTATGEQSAVGGPLLGPGPVGETFPDPLRPLEDDLWIAPLREGIRRAISLSGVVTRHRLAASPVVLLVDGRVAADLDLFGYAPGKRSGWRLIDPRPGARRLMAAWRIGQVRSVLADRIAGLLVQVDHDLAAVGELTALSDETLVGILGACRAHLVTVHAHEVLAGTLLPADEDAPSGAAVALRALGEGRRQGWSDAEIVVRRPAVLALVPPGIGRSDRLPDLDEEAGHHRSSWTGRDGCDVPDLGSRDALRLRARWLHELSARAAAVIGQRLVERGGLTAVDQVAHLRLDELVAAAAGAALPADIEARAAWSPGPSLPAAFRIAADGRVVPVLRRGGHHPGGRGAGGGRGEGRVVHADRAEPPGAGDVLVVRTLSPRLAAHLPSIEGLVAETGSVLSHLAILAREYQVPTVVAVHDALHRFPVGARVVVDGDTGEVRLVDQPDEGADAAEQEEERWED